MEVCINKKKHCVAGVTTCRILRYTMPIIFYKLIKKGVICYCFVKVVKKPVLFTPS